jgi:hypothetical protein
MDHEGVVRRRQRRIAGNLPLTLTLISTMRGSMRIGWRDVWGTVKESTERRLGAKLLLTYFLLTIAGIVAVAASVVVMHL